MAKPIGKHADSSNCWTVGCSKMLSIEQAELRVDFQLAKICSVCKRTLPLEEFAKNRARRDGLQSQCKECHRKMNQKSYKSTKAISNLLKYEKREAKVAKIKAYLLDYKLEHPCIDCGFAVVETLDFDHREGVTKLFNVSNGAFSKTLQSVENEVAKCDVRCSNCHRIKTYSDATWRTGHQRDTSLRSRIARNNELARQRKRELLLSRFAGGCIDCRVTDPRVLEMDHVRGQKVANISDMIRSGVSMRTFVEELAKCDVRCANCHRIITRSREREQKILSL